MPKTKAGKWSVGLILAMVALMLIGTSLPNMLYESVPAGDTVLEDILNRPALALSMLAGVGAGIAALITGVAAIFKRGERAVPVYGSTLVGATVTVFVIAQILFPE